MLSRSPHPEPDLVRVQSKPAIRHIPARVRAPIRLGAQRKAGVYAVLALTWGSGLGWLGFHNLVHGQGEFGPTISPLEPWWLKLHGASAMAALWTFGLLWGAHVVNGWRAGRRRWSGGAMVATMGLLGATGWLLYYAGGEGLRAVASVVHWGLGLAAAALFAWHRYLARDRD